MLYYFPEELTIQRLQRIISHVGFNALGISFFNVEILSEEDFLVSPVTDHLFMNQTTPKEDFSVPSTNFSISNRTQIETHVEAQQPNNSPLTLICPYPKASTGKSDVKRKKGNCRVLTHFPEKQEFLEEQIAKACRKFPKKNEKKVSFRIKQLSKYDLNRRDKSENLLLHDKSIY